MKNILEIKRVEKQRREEIFANRMQAGRVRFGNLTQIHCYLASASLFILSAIITIFMMQFLCFTHKNNVLPMLCLIFSLYTKIAIIYAGYTTAQMVDPFDDVKNRKAEKIEMSAFASLAFSVILLILTLIQYSL